MHRRPGPHQPSDDGPPGSYGHGWPSSGWLLTGVHAPLSLQYSLIWQARYGSSTPDVPGLHWPHCARARVVE
jgi:hypothetical protein